MQWPLSKIGQMTDIAAFLNDPTVRPAVIGFAGVAIGAVVTVSGQSMARRAERLYKVKENVAAVIAISHDLRSTQTSFHHPNSPSRGDMTLRSGWDDTQKEFIRRASVLLIIAPRSISSATEELANKHVEFDRYAHPVNGAGLATGFPDADAYLQRIMQLEDVLTNVSRSVALWRWPSMVVSKARARWSNRKPTTPAGFEPAATERETTQP